jgi:alpha,alpha-trehalose-phosphate synthase [UDP-forming]
MRLVIRLIGVLVLCILLVSVTSSYYQAQREKRSLRNELQKRAEVLADSLDDTVSRLAEVRGERELARLVQRFGNKEHLAGIAVYDKSFTAVATTPSLVAAVPQPPAIVKQAMDADGGKSQFLRIAGRPTYFYAIPLHGESGVIGGLLVVYDCSYISAAGVRAWHDMSIRVIVQVFLLALVTLIMFQRSVMKPIARTTAWMRDLRNGRHSAELPDSEMFGAFAREASTIAQSLVEARASAETEARLRDTADSSWTAERLAVCLRKRLKGSRLFVVSNREPYIHVRQGRGVNVVVPASGLVTGLEPILRACNGTWIAHGSGSADREMVDERNCLRVPPDNPCYTLRRVWLTKEQEDGYYLGFSNEGLWPLCHVAHTRPTFRATDWEQYRKVNAIFADALVEEMTGTEEPVVIIQDYHFALLPKLIKQRRPDARVGIFWHIPWPNPEAFGICPWQRELLDGLLGADLVGFHIQAHCHNFLETIESALEARVEWERFAVNSRQHTTLVRPYPISVVFPETRQQQKESFHVQQAALMREIGTAALYLGVGVDRVDYTKGILERFLAVERFIEKYPRYQGKFTFVQIGAPSRTDIKRYGDFLAAVDAEAERVNRRFATANWQPILFRKRHHTHEEVERFYRAADVCLVTSLHDGMNLVAKEYLAARSDEEGALILSPFTGAARELSDALIVNPYDIESMADAILAALEMDPAEKKSRMQRMRTVVREHNVYRWAGSLIGDLCEIGGRRPGFVRPNSTAACEPDVVVGEQVVYDLNHSGAVSAGGHKVSL